MRRFRPGPEHMDDPRATRDELAQALRFIRIINRRLGGSAALIRHLRAWSRHWPRDRAVTLLDLGTGSADIPIAAVRWARRAGFTLRITGVDLHPVTLELAREHVAANADAADHISLIHADALRLTDQFAARSFDYVHAGMFLHHLGDIEVRTALAIMDKLAARGIVWNDLLRSRTALIATNLLTIAAPRIVRHDALASIRAAFTADEVRDIARRLDLGYAHVRTSFFTQRFTLAGEKPGAWS